jgi:putative membrane protein
VKLHALVGATAGIALLIWLLTRAGLAEVADAALRLGLLGLAAVSLYQFVLDGLMAVAWMGLGGGAADAPGRPRLSGYLWARLTRDAVSQALPLTQVGGLVVGGRALALEGMTPAAATASTITDLAVEFLTQIPFVGLGAFLLAVLAPRSGLGGPVLAVVAGLGVMAMGMMLAQFWGAHWIEGLLRRVLGRDEAGATPVAQTLREIARRPRGLALAALLHFASWVLAAGQTWLILRWLHQPVSLAGALAIDSLTAGVKAVAFFVPASLGVQEGILVVLGMAFGVPPSAALALSLVRRARDLAVGVPVLIAWQLRHGGRIWSARGAADARP